MKIFESYTLLITLFALIIAVISLIVNHRNYRTTKRTVGDSIRHELINMPPYELEGDSSTIIVKNTGNTKARIDQTCVHFDWDEDLSIVLDYECDEDESYILSLNGEKHFRKTLPLPPTKGEHFITICTCTIDSPESYSNEFRAFF